MAAEASEMTTISISEVDFRVENFQPTMMLRTVVFSGPWDEPRRLQQLWHDKESGKTEWRDVPLVDQTGAPYEPRR